MVPVCTPRAVMSFCVVCLVRSVAGRAAAGHHGSKILGLQKLYTGVPLCSTLKPESVTMETICLSSCGTGVTDASLVCNPQAETWKTRLQVDVKSTFSAPDDCGDNRKRYKCVPYESNEIQCIDAAFDTYPPGFSCFTQCGELKCPSDDFVTPTAANDFKLADCKSSYRVRCKLHPSSANQQIGAPDLTMELQLARRPAGVGAGILAPPRPCA